VNAGRNDVCVATILLTEERVPATSLILPDQSSFILSPTPIDPSV
jgi:hypothetical protein